MIIERQGAQIFAVEKGSKDGPPIVFANSLGTDLSLWDQVIEALPSTFRIILFDLRGHGASPVPDTVFTMDDLVTDAESVMEHFQITEAAFVGLSIGGMIAQGLAYKRPDLVKVAILSNTAAKIGSAEMWEERIEAIEAAGLDSIADSVMERWFGEEFRASGNVAKWHRMLIETSVEGYVGCCRAIAGADLANTTCELRLPVLGIAGSSDLSTPPDLVANTIVMIPRARLEVVAGAGHLPCVEQPEKFARFVLEFLETTKYV